jgi:hypothetical protein
MSSIRALTDAAAEAVDLFHRFLGPLANSPDPRATAMLSDALREYVSPGPYGPCAEGLGQAQIAAAEQWPSPGAMECAISDTIRFGRATDLRHGEGVNLAPIAFRKYTELLLNRERLINPVRLRGLHHAAVHEAKTWGTSMPLVIERIDQVVVQINVLAGLSADLDQKQWDAIHKTARHAIDQLRPFEQRNTPTTPDNHQIARYMDAALVTSELCHQARTIPPTPAPPIPKGKNSVAWFPDGERSVLLDCEPVVGPLLKLRNTAAREALLWNNLAPTVEGYIRALWDTTQALMSVARDSERSDNDYASAFDDWCRAFDRLVPFRDPTEGSGKPPPEPITNEPPSASAKPPAKRVEKKLPRRVDPDQQKILAAWDAYCLDKKATKSRPYKAEFAASYVSMRPYLTIREARRLLERARAARKRGTL